MSPTDVCADEFMLATELACSKIKQAEAVQLRSKVANILTSSNPPKSNLSKDERQAIKELKKIDNIMILPADKGRATVVMDKEEYEQKVTTMLSDKKTYE